VSFGDVEDDRIPMQVGEPNYTSSCLTAPGCSGYVSPATELVSAGDAGGNGAGDVPVVQATWSIQGEPDGPHHEHRPRPIPYRRHTALIVAAAAVIASALSFDAASAARAEPVIVCQVGGSCNIVCR
jgi:hypothetical protein